MILLFLAFFFRDRVVLVALAAVCESYCGDTLFAGCFMEMSVAVDGGGGSCGVTVAVYTIDFTLHRPFIVTVAVYTIDFTLHRPMNGRCNVKSIVYTATVTPQEPPPPSTATDISMKQPANNVSPQ